jgi:hypothetical protein
VDAILRVLFIFIVAAPLAVVTAVLTGLFGLGTILYLADKSEERRQRLEAFRKRRKPPGVPSPRDYYRAYWHAGSLKADQRLAGNWPPSPTGTRGKVRPPQNGALTGDLYMI